MRTTAEHYAATGLVAAVEAALEAEGLGAGLLSVDDVGAIAEFHTAGRGATVALAEAAGLREGMRVLDAGAGAGGPALYLAAAHGCTVAAVDMTPEFCRLAELFARRTGLAERVTVVEGDVLALPFADGSFDAVWTQHVQMNIADKPRLYGELRRVLVHGGTLAFWDLVAAGDGDVHVPVPWATEASQSHLAGFDDLRETVRAAGFDELVAEDGTDEARAFVALMDERLRDGPPPLGLHLIVPNAKERFDNYSRNLAEGRIRLIRGVYAAV